MGSSVRFSGFPLSLEKNLNKLLRAQSRQAIQTLEEARDTIQTLHVGPTVIVTGSVDGHIRSYDLRMGELRSDFIGSMSFNIIGFSSSITTMLFKVPSRQFYQRKTHKQF